MSRLMQAIVAKKFQESERKTKARAEFERGIDAMVQASGGKLTRREAIMQWLKRPRKPKKRKKR